MAYHQEEAQYSILACRRRCNMENSGTCRVEAPGCQRLALRSCFREALPCLACNDPRVSEFGIACLASVRVLGCGSCEIEAKLQASCHLQSVLSWVDHHAVMFREGDRRMRTHSVVPEPVLTHRVLTCCRGLCRVLVGPLPQWSFVLEDWCRSKIQAEEKSKDHTVRLLLAIALCVALLSKSRKQLAKNIQKNATMR